MKKLLFLVVIVIVLVSLAIPAHAITNGEPDGGEHPYVGLVVFDIDGEPTWRTTGILISPTIVITAGHGTYGTSGARIWFDEDLENNIEYPYGGSTSVEGTPHTYTLYDETTYSGDVGIVVLDEPVVMAEYGTLPTAGIVDTLPKMTDVDMVGYGAQEMLVGGGPPILTGPKTRLSALAELIGSNTMLGDQTDLVAVTSNPGLGKGGAAPGDSGGPVLFRGTNNFMAIDVYRINPLAKGLTLAQRIDTPAILGWIDSFLP